MKTTLAVYFLLLGVESSVAAAVKSKRDYDLGGYQSDWKPSSNPFQEVHGIENLLPYSSPQFDVDLPLPHASLSLAGSNSIASASNDKPVAEPQEYVPPQSIGTAVIPLMPPPATPVNAVASNVPASNRGAVFLGSGSLGVVNLGNGAYALGSGSLGYSGQRQQPRPNIRVPLFPPLPASPELIPAAVPSAVPIQPAPIGDYQLQLPQNVNLNDPRLNPPQPPQYDRNGYEYLPPNRVGFGAPFNIPRRPKTRQQFATPNALQFQPDYQAQPQLQLFPQSQPQFQPAPSQPRLQLQSRQPTLSPSFDITIPYDQLG